MKTISTFKVSAWILISFNVILLSSPDDALLRLWNQGEISWRKLEWNDFKGYPGTSDNPDFGAQTSSGIYWKVNKVFNYPPAIAISYMNTRKSWKKSNSQTTAFSDSLLLTHEQIHFDLYELSRRTIIATLPKYWNKPIDSIDYFIRKKARQATVIGTKYDTLTKHGLNLTQQRLWTIKVNQALCK